MKRFLQKLVVVAVMTMISGLAMAQTHDVPPRVGESLQLNEGGNAFTNIDPKLVGEMNRQPDGEKINIVVIMKSQYDRTQLQRRADHYATRAERREFVVNELKQFTEASQYDLRRSLSEMERSGMTTAPQVIWMANALYFSATRQAIYDLARRNDIRIIGFAEKRYALFNETSRPANNTRDITPNITQVNADQVWSLGYTGQGVVVAVIDSGVNYNHLDLADHLWDGGAEYPNHGWDFYNNDNDPMDDLDHGTHCAGTVCGDGTAGRQTGIAPDATLMCLKVLDEYGWGDVATTCNAMQWAVEQGADVFTMSLGWLDTSVTERILLRNTCAAVLDAGVIAAVSAGDEGDEQWYYPIPNNVRLPGSCPPPYLDPVQQNNPGGLSCALCVGAVDYNDAAAYFTAEGPVTWANTSYYDYPYIEGSSTSFGLIRPDVCAPGVNIISADYSNPSGYVNMDGTSMAAPCVAGCISLLLSKNINATPAEICQILEETAEHLTEGKSNTVGYGRVDVLAAINALYAGPLTFESYTINDGQGNSDGQLNPGESVTLNMSLTNGSDIALDGATLTLTTDSEYVTITNGTATLPHFNAGQTKTIQNIFGFTLAANTPAETMLQFTAQTFVSGEFVGNIHFTATVYGHTLMFNEVTVLNDNNNNGSLEAGETANLHVVISNIGNATASSIVGTLSSSYPYLTINSPVKTFGNIGVDGQATADFSVSLSGNAPNGYTINFDLDLVDANNTHSNVAFEIWRKAITLTCNPSGSGALSGGGYYGEGQTCTITATANNNYVFVSWSLDGVDVSYLPTYTFTVSDAAEYVANFQAVTNGVVVGDGATTNIYLPSYSYYPYSYTQQIYTANELGMTAGEISSVSFFNTGTTKSRNFTVYMANTNKTAFESNSDWIPVTEANQVFSGTVAMTGGSWTAIYFNPPFTYDGTSNLVIAVDDNSNSWSSGMSCRTFNADQNQAIRISGYGTNYNPVNMPNNFSGTRMAVKDQIILGRASYDYTVTVSSNPANAGVLTGAGQYYYGQPVTLTATANNGYVFNNWTKNGEVVSYMSTFNTSVTETCQYVANFLPVNGVAVGDAISNNFYQPTYSYYPYSLTQQIYTADEMGGTARNISSVSLFNATNVSLNRNFTVYLVNTNKTIFESNTDWIAVTEADQVFSGMVSVTPNNWVTLYFGTPFAYDGTSSLALIVDDNTNGWGSTTGWRSFNTTQNQAIRIYGYGLNFDPSAPYDYNGTLVTTKNQVVFGSPSYDYTVTATANPVAGGTITEGQGQYYMGQSCTLTAVPNSGYCFYNWTENGTVVSSDATYTFTVTGNKNLVANFGVPINITATANPVEGGTVIGGGGYGNSQTCTLTAIPNEGYVFDNWTKNGTVVSYYTTYSFTVTGEEEYVANFSQMDGIAIGEGTNYNSYLPTYSYYSLTQQIYTAEELDASACEISSVSFFNVGYSRSCDLDIYMVNTNKTTFESTTDWITVTEADLVYSGNVTFAYRNWNTVYFSTPFNYDGSTNVAIVVNKKDGGWDGNPSCRIFNTEGTQAIRAYNSEYAYDPNGPINSTGTLMSLKNQIVFGIASYDYTATVVANPVEGGTVSGGGGSYYYGQPISVSATPNEGYVFDNWTRYNANNGNYEVVSYLSTDNVSVMETTQFVANFQQMEGIVVGDATHTNAYLPTSEYPYEMSQQIYTADELNTTACDISSVTFFNTGYYNSRNMDVYLVNTDKVAFETTYDWITVTEADLVFSGYFDMEATSWATLYFSTPFHYDGTSNVALIINDKSQEWGWGPSCRTFDCAGTQAIYAIEYDYAFNPSNPFGTNVELLSEKNQVIFGIPNYEYTVTATANPEEGGIVSGGGMCYYNQPVILTATPNEGYVFNYWTKYDDYYGYDEVISYLSPDQFPVTENADYVANFQTMEGLAIGEATRISWELPFSGYYYSLSQQIYTADELNADSCEISSVSFFNTDYSYTRDLDIYMVNTNKIRFNYDYDWISVTEADRVFSGSVTMDYSGWSTIYFNTAFNYDGTSNVALIVYDRSGNWGGSGCRTFDAQGTQAIYAYGYDGAIDLGNLSDFYGSLMSEKNQVVFGIANYEFTVTVSASPEEGGTVTGGGGLYFYGQPIHVTATPNEGYVFGKWTKGDETVSCFPNIDLPVTETADYVAEFKEARGIAIGEANNTSYMLPTYSGYSYSLSQQIYTVEEMGGTACDISSVSFFNTGSYNVNRTVAVYLVTTDKTVFESNSDWIAVTEADRVFNGTVAMPAKDWISIYFDTPFHYDGTSNLVLVMDDNSYSWSSNVVCRTFDTEGYQALRATNNSTNFDPYNPSSYNGSRLSMKNQVIFGYAIYDNIVTSTANPTEGGTVSGGGQFYYGQPITLTATHNEGYAFTNWTKNDSVVSYLSTYNLPATESVEYVANFDEFPNSIVIGDATNSNLYLPSYTYNPYTVTQQIYTAEELDSDACEITNVSFFNMGYTRNRNLTIYLVNTDKTSFESTTDWIPVTEADQVFSGSVSITANSWTTIYFNAPFNYDGSSNIALIVDDNSNAWNSGMRCRTFVTEESQALYVYGSGTNFDPTNPISSTGTLVMEKNQIVFGRPSYDYTLNVTANPMEGGTVSGGEDTYYYGQSVTLTATPNEGYVFTKWTKNGTAVSYLSNYTVRVTESAEYIANFDAAPNGIVIGDATYSSYYLPTYSYYSMSQQIYTADEIGVGACEISSVSFFNTGSSRSRNLTVYMVNTDKASFESNTDWIAVTEANQVYNGNVNLNATGWTTIYFNSSFNYDGASNIALIVDDNSNSWNSYTNCRTFSTDESQAIYIYGSMNYDPTHPTDYTGTLMMEKNQVVLGIPNYDYAVTVSANPWEGGTVSGGGLYYYGQSVSLTATPNEGYTFNKWTKNGSAISYLSSHTVSATESTEYIANFDVAPEGIVIGDATYSSAYLPTYSYYTLSQQIYTAEEMGVGACEISSLSFFNTGYGPTRNLTIYMVNTNKTSFDSATDWIPVTENDKVYSGSITLSGYGWATIYFNTIFNYDGTSNVAVIVDDNTNSTSSTLRGRTFSTIESQAIYINGSSDYDPINPTSYTGTLMMEKNQIVFGFPSYGYTVAVSANPAEGGTVSGGGSYFYGQPVTLTATPNEGYLFLKWTKNGSAVSYLSNYTFSMTESAEYVAHFEPIPNGIVIGDGSMSHTCLPVNSFFRYTHSQQIYTAEEMGSNVCEISSVAFFNTSSSRTRDITIYMLNTDKASFESNTDWMAVTEADQVFHGTVTFSSTSWSTIYFNRSFNYDGTSNLALIVDDNTGTYTSAMYCRTTPTQSNQAIYYYNDGSDFDPYNPSSYSGEIKMQKNQVVFGLANYQYTVSVSANPMEGGTVSGGGDLYFYGQPIPLSATANESYVFNKWTKGNETVSYYPDFDLSVTETAEYVAQFQEINGIVIGNPTSASSTLPTYSYYPYGLSQQIYTADEMGGEAIEISSVSFFNTTYGITRNLAIYMVNTDKASFESTSDWITVTEADLVFSGSKTLSGYDWATIYFDTPFYYDGTSNVALIVDDNSSTWNSSISCRTFSTEENQAIYISNSTSNYDPSDMTSYTGTLKAEKNQVVFGYASYDYTITVTANPEGFGTVSGGGQFYYGQPCTVSATPNNGYYFYYWSENDVPVSSDADYAFVVSESRELVANFGLPYAVTVTANQAAAGIVTGGGNYGYSQTCTLTATPNDGYVFNKWTKNGVAVSYLSTYTFQVTEGCEYVAEFEQIYPGVAIGDAEAVSSYLPAYYYNSMSQQIYTAEEIGLACEITSLSFFNTGTAKTRDFTIYLALTNKTSFQNSSDWVPVTAADQVFSGSVTMVSNDWTVITLDTPFYYDGVSNLVLVFDDNTGTYLNSLPCRVFNTDEYQAMYVYGYGTNYDPTNPSGYYGNRSKVKNQIVLGIIPSTMEQTIYLTRGWNWCSFNVEITLDLLKAVLVTAMPGTTISIKSRTQNTTYNPNTHRWSGSVVWDLSQMYRISVATDCQIALEGLPINPAEHPVTISNGVNWIAFPLSVDMSVSNAFNGFAVNGDQVKSRLLNTQYRNNRWNGQLNTLVPGQGYIYISTSAGDRIFTYPANAK